MKIAVFAGDGIGPEVTEQALRVLEALPLPFSFRGLGRCVRRGADAEDEPHSLQWSEIQAAEVIRCFEKTQALLKLQELAKCRMQPSVQIRAKVTD